VIAILASALLAVAVSLPPQDARKPSRSADAAHGAGGFAHLAEAAKAARDGNRDDEAIQLYRQALKLKPEWDEGLWYLGTLLYEKENYFEACETLRRFLAEDPKAGYGWALLGMSEFQTREYTRALDHLQQSMVLGLGDNRKMQITVYYLTALLLTRAEHFDEGMSLLSSLSKSGDSSKPLVEPFGLAALRIPLLPAEIPAARREMIRIAGAAVVALDAQHYDDAEKLFAELERAYPEEPGVHFLIGAYLLGPRPDEGIKELKRELEISPSHVPARIRLAEEYTKREEMDRAIPLVKEALTKA